MASASADTAGLKKKGKIYESVEKYSILRALSAVEKSDVVLVVVDGERGIIEQDKHVAGNAHEAGKGVILVVNKWDLVQKDEKTMQKMEKELREQFKYLDYAPIVFVSAKENKRIHLLLPLIQEVYANNRKRVSTSVLNDILIDAQTMNPTTTFNGGRLKIYYANLFAKIFQKRSFSFSKKLLSSFVGFGLKLSLCLIDSNNAFSSLVSFLGIHTAIFT